MMNRTSRDIHIVHALTKLSVNVVEIFTLFIH